MAGFIPRSNTYVVDQRIFPEQRVSMIRIEDIGPVRRSPGTALFNDCGETGLTARERVVRILHGFSTGNAIAPVKILKSSRGDVHRYKLIDGAHRLYCSVAAGYTHIPAVKGLDMARFLSAK